MPATDTPDRTSAARTTGGNDPAGVDPKLLEILVCPVTKQALSYDREAQELISDKAGLAFPIRGGVPIMLVEEARRIDEAPFASAADTGPESSGG
ncbi:MAG: Trm112 family protein [Alphaproteobacteria bacterium]|nr:Trm112 family protein [Alphaproteobacteria bacterium]